METIQIERLIKANEINQNGVMYDEESLTRSLDTFIQTKGEVRLESMTVEEYNEKAKNKAIKDDLYPVIGKIVGYNETHFIIEPLNKAIDIEAIKSFRTNINAYASDIIEKKDHKVAIIDEVSRIIVGQYKE